MGDRIELETHEDNSTAREAKSVPQLLQYFRLYGQIMIHFAPFLVQLELLAALTTYVDCCLSYSMLYT